MDIGDFSSETLLSNINKLLDDPTYKRNAHLSSAILRDRPDTAAQRVFAMIDHVIKYGDEHLRTGAFELSIAQFFMFDVIAFLLTACISVLLAVILMCYCVYRTCRRCCYTRKKLINHSVKASVIISSVATIVNTASARCGHCVLNISGCTLSLSDGANGSISVRGNC